MTGLLIVMTFSVLMFATLFLYNLLPNKKSKVSVIAWEYIGMDNIYY